MKSAKVYSVSLVGIRGYLIDVEVALGMGLPRTVLVGLPDTSISEAVHRCRAAAASQNITWPNQLVTINLSPASLPKTGTHFDLAMMIAILATKGIFDVPDSFAALGELSLDGLVRPVQGLIPMLLTLRKSGIENVVVSNAQLCEAKLISGLRIFGVDNLGQLVSALVSSSLADLEFETANPTSIGCDSDKTKLDLADVIGQTRAKWALEVAAAGRHHIYFHGPPGAGKTLLAQRLPSILPKLTDLEAMEVSAIHSLVGADLSSGLITMPPFAAPHHSASLPAIVGGGSRIARPGAITLAHLGVLFLDEAPEFKSTVLEALRQPLESKEVTLHRVIANVTYPANFMLVLAANDCPCGRPPLECNCTSLAKRRYRSRLSGPILDRIDINQPLESLKESHLAANYRSENSVTIRKRVMEARERQLHRMGKLNADLAGFEIRKSLPLPKDFSQIEEKVRTGALSARGVDKVLRLAWTLTDLAGLTKPTGEQLSAALILRGGR